MRAFIHLSVHLSVFPSIMLPSKTWKSPFLMFVPACMRVCLRTNAKAPRFKFFFYPIKIIKHNFNHRFAKNQRRKVESVMAAGKRISWCFVWAHCLFSSFICLGDIKDIKDKCNLQIVWLQTILWISLFSYSCILPLSPSPSPTHSLSLSLSLSLSFSHSLIFN